MDKILIYNNCTQIAEQLEAFWDEKDSASNSEHVEKRASIGLYYERAERPEIRRAESLEAVQTILKEEEIQLMLVDVEMKDDSWQKSIDTIMRLRHASSIPMMVISMENRDMAKIMALDAGADDYVTADCNVAELAARIKSQIDRYKQLTGARHNIEQIYRYEDLEINDLQRKVTIAGKPVKLTPIEYKILRFLVKQKGRVFSNDEIYETVWEMNAFGADNTIAVHIRHIREKIERDPATPKYLKVVWGQGYMIG